MSDAAPAIPSSTKQSIFITPEGRNVFGVFVLVTTLFALWGFCNGMIDTMDQHFQQELKLNLSQSAWVQFAHFLGYFLMALPAGWLAARLGYKGGIIAGLLMVAVGGLWFIPATHIAAFWAFLLGVCIIAAGLTFLETVANPYTTVLGDQRYAATRINLAQSFNGIGALCGPIAGSLFFYSRNAAGENTGSQTLWIPYAGVAVTVIILSVIFFFTELPEIKTEDDYHLDDASPNNPQSIWSHSHFVMAVAAQFFYVAAQACIFGFFINYMISQVPAMPPSWNSGWLHGRFDIGTAGKASFTPATGALLNTVASFCFLVGRFIGASVLKKTSAHRVLALYGAINVVVCLLIFCKLGWLSVACIFLAYFFMSIMFPTIFALGIFGLGSRSKQASAFIVMAIMGGAVAPKLMGYISDQTNLSRGFIVPLCCFAFVAVYGYLWPKLARSEGMHDVAVTSGH